MEEIKIKVGSCIECLAALKALNERQVTLDGKETILPEKKLKNKAVYWLGRLEDKLSSIEEVFKKSNDKIIKSLGEKVLKDGKFTGNYIIPAEKLDEYNSKYEQLIEQEEIVQFNKLDYSLFEPDEKESSIDVLPKVFWSTVGIYFINEPK